jgi:hypothetical protein
MPNSPTDSAARNVTMATRTAANERPDPAWSSIPPLTPRKAPLAASDATVTIPHDPIHFHPVMRIPRAQAWM